MIRKLTGLLALVMASFVVAPGLVGSANAADDPYTNGVRTSCHLSVPAVIQVSHAPRIRITVRPNGPAPAAGARAAQRAERPTGTVALSITRGGTRIFYRTLAYNGAPVTVVGPVIKQPGHYVVDAKFRSAEGSTFKSCQSATAFDIRKADGPDPGPGPGPNPNGGNDNPGGLLPDTGGPDVGWLLLGLALVGAGMGLVMAARGRHKSAYLV